MLFANWMRVAFVTRLNLAHIVRRTILIGDIRRRTGVCKVLHRHFGQNADEEPVRATLTDQLKPIKQITTHAYVTRDRFCVTRSESQTHRTNSANTSQMNFQYVHNWSADYWTPRVSCVLLLNPLSCAPVPNHILFTWRIDYVNHIWCLFCLSS